MRRVKMWSLLLVVIAMMVVGAIELFAEQTTNKLNITIRQSQPQTVIYTVYRGSYEKIGLSIIKLFALAGQKGIYPRGQLSCVYLNNPGYVSSEHLLTEIRIPVGEDALKLAGTLGEMTDVKALPAMEVAVAEKPVGLTDLSALYNDLYSWIAKQNYRTTENACEKFLSGGMSGNYAQMKSEIMIPVRKLSGNED